MRTLRQPGPVHPVRFDVFRGAAERLRFRVPAGVTLNDGLTAPLVAAGFQAGTIVVRGAVCEPFRFVMPGPADSPAHVAYFTAPEAPEGPVRIEQANATFGWAAGAAAIHCHASWMEADGRRRGGHILPSETRVSEAFEAEAWVFSDVRIEIAQDPETNFPLFQPSGASRDGTALVARIKPNEDVLTALEQIATVHGMRDAEVRGSLGSLVGARFTDGRQVDDIATEVLVRQGRIRDGIAELEMVVVDGSGGIHEGWLMRGENAVCITFDLVLTV